MTSVSDWVASLQPCASRRRAAPRGEDLAVEDNPQAPIRVAHRLLPAAEVDNAQPGATQTDAALSVVECVDAKLVWPAVADGAEHCLQRLHRHALIRLQIHPAGNSTHLSSILSFDLAAARFGSSSRNSTICGTMKSSRWARQCWMTSRSLSSAPILTMMALIASPSTGQVRQSPPLRRRRAARRARFPLLSARLFAPALNNVVFTADSRNSLLRPCGTGRRCNRCARRPPPRGSGRRSPRDSPSSPA